MVSARLAVAVALVVALAPPTFATLYQAHPTSCLDPSDSLTAPDDQQLVFSALYAQFDQGQAYPGEYGKGLNYSTIPALADEDGVELTGMGSVLRILLVGTTGAESEGFSNTTSFLSTVVVDSQVLTFPVQSNQSALCSSIRTPTSNTSADTGCPYGPGEVALGISIPLSSSYALTTINSQLVILDPSVPAMHLACLNLDLTPYYPSYFFYPLIRYLIVGTLAFYLVIYLIARLWASHTDIVSDNETLLASSLTIKLSSQDQALPKRKIWASIWYGAWSGRQVVGSGSLRRFVTAEFRELWGTAVWFTLFGTVAVQWPHFSYPVFAKTAWTTLIYNSSLPFVSPSSPLLPTNFTAPADFASQVADETSPLYLNSTLAPVLLDLSTSATGIEKWASSVGVRKEDLWSVAAFTFIVICGAVILAHAVCLGAAYLLEIVKPVKGRHTRLRNPPGDPSMSFKESGSGGGSAGGRAGRTSSSSMPRGRPEFGSTDEAYLAGGEEENEDFTLRPRPEDDYPAWQLHLSLLQGNLTRVLLLFHLPLTIFSIYQLSLFHESPTSTFVLAVIFTVFILVLAPFILLVQIYQTAISELYTSLPILLAKGPLFNTFSEECTMFSSVRLGSNIIVGVVIGAAQSSGIAQAAVILLVEVGDTLITSLWLPWGDNAAMGPLAFVLSISRIITAVLLVVLSPTVNVSDQAGSWLAYIIFLLQGLVLLLLIVVLVFKMAELAIRFIAKVPFDESRSPRAGGLFGVLRKWDRGGGGKKRRGRSNAGGQRRKEIEARRKRNQMRLAGSESTVGTMSRMLPPGAAPASHARTPSSMSMTSYGENLNSSASYGRVPGGSPTTQQGQGQGQDDDYIMSAMSNSNWREPSPGYVKPGSYSTVPQHHQQHQQPILRSGPTWGDRATVVPAPTIPAVAVSAPPASGTSSGFTRVGGGRSSATNPYQLAGKSAYPPYPTSSADAYSAPSNPRRHSQSAIIEMASAADPASSRPRHSPPMPSSSNLLSNASTPYRPPAAPLPPPKAPSGFFGRFKKRPPPSDFSSDDAMSSDEEYAAPRSRKWPLRFGGKKKQTVVEEEEEEEVEPEVEQKGFSVVRKPRPRPAGAGAGTGAGAGVGVAGEAQGQLAPPAVRIEGPSRSSTPHEAEGQAAEVEEWGTAS